MTVVVGGLFLFCRKRQPSQTSRVIKPQRSNNSSVMPPYKRRVAIGRSSANLRLSSMISGNKKGRSMAPQTTTNIPPTTPPIIPGSNWGLSFEGTGEPAAIASATGADRPTFGASNTPINTARARRTEGCIKLRTFRTGVNVGTSVPAGTGIRLINADKSTRRKERTPIIPASKRIRKRRVFMPRVIADAEE